MDLILYFSQYGHTKKLVEEINKTLRADVVEVKAKRPITGSRTGVMIKGGFIAAFKIKSKIIVETDITKYDRIIIGSPTWAGTIAPYIRTFITSNDLSGKKIAFFASYDGSEGKSYEHVKKLIGEKAEYISNNGFKTGKEEIEKALSRTSEWALNLLTM